MERDGSLLYIKQGCGKTLIALTICKQNRDKNVLILCPKSIISTWSNEREKWYPELELGRKTQSRLEIRGYEEAMKLDKKYLRSLDIVIADECQAYKQPDSKRSKWFAKVVEETEAKIILMSGTPFPNGIHEAHRLYSYIDATGAFEFISKVGRLKDFREKFQERDADLVVYQGNRRIQIPRYKGFKNQNEFHSIVEPVTFYQRTTPNLPSMREYSHYVETSIPREVDAQLQQIALDNGRDAANFMTALTLSAVSKAKAWAEYIADSGEDAVVAASVHPDAIEVCHKELKRRDISVALFTADMTDKAKDKSLRQFLDGEVTVLLGSLLCMREGLNLQRARLLVLNDVAFTPGFNQQMISRIHRQGQTRECRVVYIVRRGVDARLTQIWTSKASVIDEIEAKFRGEDYVKQPRNSNYSKCSNRVTKINRG